MSRDLNDLVSRFRRKADLTLAACKGQGITMRPFFTRRSPWEQARIWRSTRSSYEVLQAVERLKANGAPYLASVLVEVGPQYSPPSARGHLTNALPGESWHQWDEALDCFWLLDNQAIWSTKREVEVTIAGGMKHQVNGYAVYATEAVQAGLLSAGMSWGWDWPHIQLRPEGSPHDVYLWSEINKWVCDKYGATEVS